MEWRLVQRCVFLLKGERALLLKGESSKIICLAEVNWIFLISRSLRKVHAIKSGLCAKIVRNFEAYGLKYWQEKDFSFQECDMLWILFWGRIEVAFVLGWALYCCTILPAAGEERAVITVVSTANSWAIATTWMSSLGLVYVLKRCLMLILFVGWLWLPLQIKREIAVAKMKCLECTRSLSSPGQVENSVPGGLGDWEANIPHRWQ